MNTNAMHANVAEHDPSLLAPVARVNKMAITDLEKLIAFQMSTLTSYVDLSLGEFKAATDLTQFKDLQSFYNRQLELSSVFHKKVIDDATALFELNHSLTNEFVKLAEEYSGEWAAKAA
jgi:phasin family protein